MNKEMWSKVIERKEWFYNVVINKNNREEKANSRFGSNLNNIAERAVQYALFPSVNRSCKYYGKNEQAKNCFNNDVKPLLVNYIINNYNNGKFEMDDIYDLMIKIKKLYHSSNYDIKDYTIGNAQKLVSMSFKMFFLLLDHYNIRTIKENDDFMGYNYCVMDGIVTKIMRREYQNIQINYHTWFECDDINVFKTIQEQLFELCKQSYFNNFFYEMLAWNR